jgi:SulP family sulfate permease
MAPERWLPVVTAGLIAGTLSIVIEISLAALIFSGELAAYTGRGIGMALFGAVVTGILAALTSSFRGAVAIPQDSPAAILAVAAATIGGSAAGLGASEGDFATVAALIILTSLVTGAVLVVMGVLRLGSFVRYMPYPVVGGFLAGTGWLLFEGGMGVMTGVPMTPAGVPLLFAPDVWPHWLPGVLFAVALLLILRRYSHFLIIPSMLAGAIGLFYLALAVTQTGVVEAQAGGWLLGPFPAGGLWQPLTPGDLALVDWAWVARQAGTAGTTLVISVIAVLLNASGLELTLRQDVDLNRELRSAGVANLLAGLGGGHPGYPSLSLSSLGHWLGATSRWVGVITALLCALMLALGAQVVTYFPKVVLGGLVVFLGLAFLVEWLYDAWFKLSKADYAMVVMILAVTYAFGMLAGVGVGIVLAVTLFVVQYSKVDVVKHALSGETFQSRVDRPRLDYQLLRQKGAWTTILELQGFLFFGTANGLLDRVRARIEDPARPGVRHLLLDFRQVTGLDASAALSFTRMHQVARAKEIVLVLTHLRPALSHALGDLLDAEGVRQFADLDHGLEWCEEQTLAVFREVGLGRGPRGATSSLAQVVAGSPDLARLRDFLYGEAAPAAPRDEVPAMVARLAAYLERREGAPGDVLIAQGAPAPGVFFIESGGATVMLTTEEGRTQRLRRVGAGTMVGELALYTGGDAALSVVLDQPSVLTYLSRARLAAMAADDPELAAAFHEFTAQRLSERLTGANATIAALLG